MNMTPYETRIIIPLKDLDNQFSQIQELIEVKRSALMKKQNKLRHLSKQNHFLQIVRDDYEKYHDYISQQKRDQIKALEILDSYINDLTMTGKLTKCNMEDAKEEQKKILKELNSIKNSLDNIIKDTKQAKSVILPSKNVDLSI